MFAKWREKFPGRLVALTSAPRHAPPGKISAPRPAPPIGRQGLPRAALLTRPTLPARASLYALLNILEGTSALP